MSTLADIIAEIEDLLEGSTGVDHTVPVGKFTVVGDDFSFAQAQCSEDPRPVFIASNEDFVPEDAPSDVSGNYRWRGNVIRVYIEYAFDPDDDPTERQRTMADDKEVAVQCLEWPLNHALVTDWCGNTVSTAIEEIRDDDGVVAIAMTVIECRVEYREITP